MILKQDEKDWRLKSRATWINLRDNNTRFFHSFASYRRNMNLIWELTDDNGSIVKGQEELQRLEKSHFEKILKKD